MKEFLNKSGFLWIIEKQYGGMFSSKILSTLFEFSVRDSKCL